MLENPPIPEVLIALAKTAGLLVMYALAVAFMVVFVKPTSQKQAYKNELEEISQSVLAVGDASEQLQLSTRINEFTKRWENEGEWFNKRVDDDTTSLKHKLYESFRINVLENQFLNAKKYINATL